MGGGFHVPGRLVGVVALNLATFAAVGMGAALGAWLRWGLGMWLNPAFALIPLGTLVANLVGGLAMGFALAAVQAWPGMAPALKLLLTTGLLGGLTTFSTFSAEAFHLLQRGALGWLGLHLSVHVVGSVLMTWAGYAFFNALRA